MFGTTEKDHSAGAVCRKIMLSRYHVLVLVLCLSAAEDFDWTKNDHGSFYYGTFPAGMSLSY